jgi:hypothetical protein
MSYFFEWKSNMKEIDSRRYHSKTITEITREMAFPFCPSSVAEIPGRKRSPNAGLQVPSEKITLYFWSYPSNSSDVHDCRAESAWNRPRARNRPRLRRGPRTRFAP